MSEIEFYYMVKALCRLFDCSMTSGPRTVSRNAAVGGVPGSRHLPPNGTAFDIVPDNLSDEHRSKIVAAAWALGIEFVLDEGDHIHVHLSR